MTSAPSKMPPRFVPTLTEVVYPVNPTFTAAPQSSDQSPARPGDALEARAPAPLPEVSARPIDTRVATVIDMEARASGDPRAHRVLQRLDAVLESRLRDAITSIVQEHVQTVMPLLREEIESVVLECVQEAVADELASEPLPVVPG